MHQTPVKYLILIETDGAMVARLFDGERRHVADIDAASEEVAVMTTGLLPSRAGNATEWARALAGYNPAERSAAQVFSLDV